MGDEEPQETASVIRRGLRLIRRYMRGQPVTVTLSITGATIFAISAVGTTVVLGRATDDLIIPAFEGGATRDALVGSMIALLAVTILRAMSIVLRRYFGIMTVRRSQASLRRQVTDRYLDVPLSYHRRTPTGRLLAHADNDIEAATEVLLPLPFTIGVSVLLVFSLVSLVLVDPWLAAVALFLFPTLGIFNRIYTSRVEVPAAEVQRDVGSVSTVAHESIDGALMVKTLGREQDEVERLGIEADRLRLSRIRVGRLRAAFEPTIDALPNLGVVILLALGSWEIATERITTGELVQAMALFGILAFPMRVVGFFLEEMPRSVVSIDRIDGVLAEPSAPRPAAPAPLPSGPLPVEFDHVRYRHDGVDVLRDVSFDVAAGEVVALVGSTGSGKTTLCNLLMRADDPDGGTVRVGGVDLAEADTEQRRAAVALVFQESFLFADSVRENISLGAEVDEEQVRSAADVARAHDFISEMPHGYDSIVGERGVTLSGGQRQRVSLARALVRSPRVLVLDDATSAVDPTVEAQILGGLRSSLDASTLVVAHRLSTIELADRVVFLDDGRVSATGPHRELLAIPEYEAIVRAYEDES